MTEGDYDKLSAIAPTVAGVEGGTDYFSPWDDQTVLIAAALGEEDEGRRLVEDIKTSTRRSPPSTPSGKARPRRSARTASTTGCSTSTRDGLNTEFLSYLGFEINPKLAPLVRRAGEQVTVSAERLDVIDADVIVFATEKPNDIANLNKVPTFDKLDAVAEQTRRLHRRRPSPARSTSSAR